MCGRASAPRLGIEPVEPMPGVGPDAHPGNLGFLDPSLFWLGNPDFGGWISLDFLGFSRSKRDLSTGYAA